MRICRYNADKLGLVKGDQLIDVTLALEKVPKVRWPRPQGDAMIANLEAIIPEIDANRKMGYVQGVNNVTLKSPIANPTKIIAAPANYMDHVAEAQEDAEINFGREIKTIDDYGLFLKANSALVGAGEGIADPFRWVAQLRQAQEARREEILRQARMFGVPAAPPRLPQRNNWFGFGAPEVGEAPGRAPLPQVHSF